MYLTSFIIVVIVILVEILPMREAFAYMGEPVMILNIGSFIMASALVVTGLAKRVSLYLVLRMSKHLALIFWAFILLNLLLGAFIRPTWAKTALLLPLFMVISAMYGATGGESRNSVGRDMVLQNLLANNVSASAYITGSAANLLAALMLEKAGARVFYGDWLIALLPLAVIQCAIAWWTGVKLIFPITKADATLKIEGGMQHLADELKKLGPISSAEIRAGVVFLLVLGLWATDRMHGIRAEVVAVAGACAVMVPAFSGLPRFGVMMWNDADIPWHMLMFSWGAYVLGGMVDKTGIMDIATKGLFATIGITIATPKVLVFLLMSGLFGITTLITGKQDGTNHHHVPHPGEEHRQNVQVGPRGILPALAFMINQVYVLYFNSKPANIAT